MNIETILTTLFNNCFAIGMCGVLAWYIWRTQNRIDRENREEKRKQEREVHELRSSLQETETRYYTEEKERSDRMVRAIEYLAESFRQGQCPYGMDSSDVRAIKGQT